MKILFRPDGAVNRGLRLNGRLTFNDWPIFGVAADLDGTLVDREPLYFAAHVAVAQDVGVHINPQDFQDTIERVPNFFGGPGDAIMRQIYELGNKHMTVEQMLKADHQLFLELVNAVPSIEPRPGVLQLLNKFKDADIPLSLGSVTDEEDAMVTLEKSGLLPFFSNIILRRDVTNPKPDPEVYNKTAALIGIRPVNQLILEDSPTGVRAAVDSGGYVIAAPVDPKESMILRLAQLGAHQIIDDWGEIYNDLHQHPEIEGQHIDGAQEGGDMNYRPLDGGMAARR